MHHFIRQYGSILFPVVFILALLVSSGSSRTANAEELPPAQAVQAALDAARQASAYRFNAHVEQHVLPRALPSNIGKQGSKLIMNLEGETIGGERTRLQWYVGESPQQDAPTAQILMDGNEAYIGKDGRWIRVEEPLGAAAPAADSLTFLDAITAVERLPDVQTAAGMGTRYAFAIDGPAYAEMMRERTQKLLSQDMGIEVQVKADQTYWKLQGNGELWVGSDGLPQRLIVDLLMPEVTDNYDSQVHMQVDFNSFGSDIAAIAAPVDSGDGNYVLPPPTSSVERNRLQMNVEGPVSDAAAIILLTLVGGGLAIWLVTRRRRTLYAIIVGATTFSMVVGFPLQVFATTQSLDRLSRRAGLSDALTELGITSSVSDQIQPSQTAAAAPVDLAPSIDTVVDCLTLPNGVVASDDYDNDGMDNVTEHCLGTDYREADSDFDTISDTDELTGFSLGGKTWTTNPLQRDSNLDGMDDASEWTPNWVTNSPNTLDVDGDGIPNPWDNDNDGDGVIDELDNSPYDVLGYKSSYDLTVSKPSGDLHSDTYVYIDLTIQPQDASHLRYNTTPLDWPYDDKAQIKDLDHSKEDVKLIPMVEFKSCTRPSLIDQYGLVVADSTTSSDPDCSEQYQVLAPLTAVGNYGAIDAFKTRVAWTPNETAAGVDLTDVRMGWLVQVKTDTQKIKWHYDYQRHRWVSKTTINSTDEVAVSYYESKFRLTGLKVTESEDVEVALFGAPNAPETTSSSTTHDEGREIFNLATNMIPRVLYYEDPDFQSLVSDFSHANNSIYSTWHISSTLAVDYKTYGHEDEALAATTMTETPNLLSNNYSNSRTPMLVIGYEETTGALGLGQTDGVSISDNDITVDLSKNTLATLRQVQINQYQHDSGGWSAFSMNEAITELDSRYPNQADQRVKETIDALYLTYYGGMVNYVAVNGTTVVGTTANDQAFADLTDQPQETTLPGYVNATYQIDYLVDLSETEGEIEGWRTWQDALLASGADTLNGVMNYAGQLISRLPDDGSISDGFYWGNRVSPTSVQNVSGSADSSNDPTSNGNSQSSAANAVVWLSSVGAIIETAEIWTQYSNHKGNVSDMQSQMELATAIAATIVTVVLFLLASPLLFIGDLLIAFMISSIFGKALDSIGLNLNLQGVFDDIVKWLVGVISDFTLYSKLKDDNPVTSSPLGIALSNEDEGLVEGNGVGLTITYTTAIVKGPGKSKWNWTHSRSGRVSDVNDSTAHGKWNWNSATASVTHDTPSNSSTVCSEATDDYPQRNCVGNTVVTVTPQEAVRDLGISLTTTLYYSLKYQSCWGVSVVYDSCERRTTSGWSPTRDDTDAWNNASDTIYLDVFPDTLSKLWGWSDINNPDFDGDSVSTVVENVLPTSASNWDTDGDNVSDYYEIYEVSSIPWSADSDHDGLNDYQELLIGTSPTVADTDGDGLKDGKEVCYFNGSVMKGGWEVTTLGSGDGFKYYVCSNPLEADEDNDTMTDSQEKKVGTSPFMPNTAPRLTQTVLGPLFDHDNTVVTILGPDDTLTEQFSLLSDMALPITRTLSWCGDTGVFGDLSVTDTSSNSGYTMPTPTSGSVGDQDCTFWDFSQNAIHTGEQVSVTLEVPASSTAPSGIVTQTLTLPYIDPIDLTLSSVQVTQPLIVDTDVPTTTISAPADDDFIDGGSYVVGGVASDATSWVTGVEVSVDSGDWQAATGTDSWAWTWTLPADGTYTISSRATDVVDNVQSPPTSISVTVDNTAPGASFTSLSDGQVISDITPNSQGGAAIVVQGSATDLLSGVSLASGVGVVQLSIDGHAWEAVWPTNRSRPEEPVSWSHIWEVDAQSSGSHTLKVRAIDTLGHVGDETLIEVIIDVLAPLVTVGNYSAQLPGNTTSTLTGYVDDTGNVPLPSRPKTLAGDLDSLDDATTWWEAGTVSDLSGATATWIGDFNADGLSDAAIGMPSYGSTGQVVIMYGAPGGWPIPSDVSPLSASASTITASDASQLGQYLAPAGDVNGDGLSDLLIGDSDNNRVFVIYGRVGTTGSPWDVSALGQNGRTAQKAYGLVLTAGSGTVGQWIASAGDVNDDGYGDLLVGTSTELYLVTGRSRFAYQTIDITTDAAAVVPFDGNGSAMAIGVGDMDGDLFGDFAISDPAGGQVYLFNGSKDFRTASVSFPQQSLDPTTDAVASFTGDSTLGEQLLALGDVNGDGYSDFMYSSGSAPRLVFGIQGGGWGQNHGGDRTLSYSPAAAGVLSAPGDVNADGYDDIVLGNASGDSYLIHGASSLASIPNIEATISDVQSIASTPYSLGADLNGDSSSDLLVLPSGIGGATASASALFTSMPQIHPSHLPISGGAGHRGTSQINAAGTETIAGTWTAHVDDDYCATCDNDGYVWYENSAGPVNDAAFSNLQTAVNMTFANGTVLVKPGVYSSIKIATGGLLVKGVDADAVFIDGGGGDHAVKVRAVTSVTLNHLTLRNATNGLRLQTTGTYVPGEGGQANAGLRIKLKNSAIYDVTNGVRMPQAATLDVKNSTLVGNSAGDANIFIEISSAQSSQDSNTSIPEDASSTTASLPNLRVKTTALVSPTGTASPTWINLSASTNDFSWTSTGSEWVGAGAWSPAAESTQITFEEADFVDTIDSVYRTGADTLLTSGYHTYLARAHVSASYCATCANDGYTWGVDAFDNIQSAINSGAAQVQVRPGIYRDQVYLVSGVEVIGAGGEISIAELPADATEGTLFKGEGVRGASVAHLTLNGSGIGDGMIFEDGASGITVDRTIIRNTNTGVTVSDSDTEVVMANLTVVNNQTGVLASACGSVDVRNTIFAYQDGTGLDTASCATTSEHTYNLFWRNNDDLLVDSSTVGSPTPGEVFEDPLFVNASQHNYQISDNSPGVNAGDPDDPSLPGSGDRIDIGAWQHAQASFYADDDYCETCANDGLNWQINAFDTIQSAVDAAATTMASAFGSGSPVIYSIGVAGGAYNEDVTLPSYTYLQGVGADSVIIDGSGSGSVVTIDGATRVQVSGVTVTGSGVSTDDAGIDVIDASNNVTVTRNIVRNNANGILFADGSNGVVINNTLVGNSTDTIRSEDPHTWISVRNNILSYGDKGMHSTNGGTFINDYNLLDGNTSTGYYQDSVVWLMQRPNEAFTTDPMFNNPGNHDYSLQVGSPAVNKADPFTPLTQGGGTRADLGYAEVIAMPATVLFGLEGTTSVDVNSGVSTTQVGISYVVSNTIPISDTIPTNWSSATVSTPGETGSYWTADITPGPNDGLYRLYTQGSDVSGNPSAILYSGAFLADSTAPVVNILDATSTDMIAHYQLDEGSGLTARDSSGNSYDGNLQNGPTFTTNVAPVSFTNPYALDFDGVDDYVSISDTRLIDDLKALTLAAWAEPDTVPLSDRAQYVSLGGGKASLLMQNSQFEFELQIDGSSYSVSGGTPFAGFWQHVAGTYDGETMRLYVNGSEVSSLAMTGTVQSGNGVALNSSNEPYDGRLDDVRIYSSALDTNQLSLLISSGDATSPATSLKMDVSDWLPTGVPGETIYNVAQVYFDVDGITYGASPSATLASQGQTQRYETRVALEDGTHTITAYAVDRTGNIGQSDSTSLTVTTMRNEAAMTDPLPGATVASASLTLRGNVHYMDSDGDGFMGADGQLEILVDGSSQGMATVDSTSDLVTSWSKDITLSGDGDHTITMRASLADGTSDSSDMTSTLILDTTAPTLAITSPVDGTVVNQNFSLTGSTTDSGAGAGVASLETSSDGGFSWMAQAFESDGSFDIDWSITDLQDYVSYPILVRSSDWAGNSQTKTANIIIDSLGPVAFEPINFSPDAGSHLTTDDLFAYSWPAPLDGSGTAIALMDTSAVTDTIPTTVIGEGNQGLEAAFPGAGTWYIHLMFEDGVGNQSKSTYGPYYVEAATSTLAAASAENTWTQSIIIDGLIDIRNGEWRPDREELDADPRGDALQSLYTVWDEQDLYLGWQDTLWALHGSAWFYFDTKTGGNRQAIHTPALELPMGADYALEINSSTEGTLWRYDDNSWQPLAEDAFSFAHGAIGDTEIRIPLTTIEVQGSLSLLAFAYNVRTATISTVFPTTNPVATCTDDGNCPHWQDVYTWPSLGPDVIPNAGQPQGHHAQVVLSSPQGLQTGWGPGETLQYVATVRNLDHVPLDQVGMILDGSPGLSFESLDKGVLSLAQSDRWYVQLDEMVLGEIQEITLTTRLSEDLTAIDFVTVTAELDIPLSAMEPILTIDHYTHRVDSQAPEVAINLAASALPPGAQLVSGTAHDADGGGVDRVEVSVNGGPWMLAEGTVAWLAVVHVPSSDTFNLAARAIDVHGYVSAVEALQVAVDAEAPTADIALDSPLIGGRIAHVMGTASDSGGSGVAEVQIQINGRSWVPLALPLEPASGDSVRWRYNWSLPREDGSHYTLAVRAVDGAGNVGAASEGYEVIVDSIAPVTDILDPLPGADVLPPSLRISGVAYDNNLDTVEVSVDGGQSWQLAELEPPSEGIGNWSAQVALPVPGWETLIIQSRGIDLTGNRETLGAPVRVHVQEDVIPLWMPLVVQ